MRVYLGSPIDTSVSEDRGSHFRALHEALKEAFGSSPFVAFNPLTAYMINQFVKVPETDCQYILDLNLKALEDSDLAVFYLDDSPTVGVPIEIYLAANKTPVGDQPTTFLWLNSMKSAGVVLRALSGLVIVRSKAALVEAIRAYCLPNEPLVTYFHDSERGAE